jgi:integrase/recombinase XerD
MRPRRRRRLWAPKVRPVGELVGMWALREGFLEWMLARNYSPETVRRLANDLRRFLAWCDDRSVREPTEVTVPIVERYQRWLFYYRRPDGRPLSFRTQHHLLCTVKSFFRWLTRQRLTLYNPAAEIELPKQGVHLPRDILTAEEAERVIGQPDVETPLGIRDRAMLETFYSTGIRRKELAGLTVYDIDAARGSLMVREGKNRKDRVVPIGERARAWIERYVTQVRPAYAMEPDEGYLFLTVEGGPFRRLSHLSEMVHRYLDQANIAKKGGCHIFRHTMATLMLENGADIRFIQEMLGHARLSATEVYTHVSIQKLRQIHQATHPAEQARQRAAPADAAAAQELEDALERERDEEGEPAPG